MGVHQSHPKAQKSKRLPRQRPRTSVLGGLAALLSLSRAQTNLPDQEGAIFDLGVSYTLTEPWGPCSGTQLMADSVTTESFSDGTDTIFVTTFGMNPQGFNYSSSGYCAISTADFLTDYTTPVQSPTRMGTKAEVVISGYFNKYHHPQGINFKDTTANNIGVIDTCRDHLSWSDYFTSDITFTNQLRMRWGIYSTLTDHLLVDINETIQTNWPIELSVWPTCQFQVALNFNDPNFALIGTQGQEIHDLEFAEVNQLALYYKRIETTCLSSISFSSASESFSLPQGNPASQLALQALTKNPPASCPQKVVWTVQETTIATPTEPNLQTQIGSPFTFSPDTVAPDMINIGAIPAAAIEKTYTFKIIATALTNNSITASYGINIAVVDPCLVANLDDNSAGQLIDPTPFEYLGQIQFQTTFLTDQAVCTSSDITYTCSATPTLPFGGDICSQQDSTGAVTHSWFTGSSLFLDGTGMSRATLQRIPPNTYTVTVEGTIPGGSSTPAAVTHTFTVEVVDPCLDTVGETIEPIDQTVFINSTPTQVQVSMTDSVSVTHGNKDGVSFCGPRKYEISSVVNWASIDSTGLITITQTDVALAGQTIDLFYRISLAEYPSYYSTIFVESSFAVTFQKGCADATWTVPTQAEAGWSDDIYWLSYPLQSTNFFNVYSLSSIDVSLNCGAWWIKWYVTGVNYATPTELNTSVFIVDFGASSVSYQTTDPLQAGDYTLSYRIHLELAPENFSAMTDGFKVLIKDRCSIEGGLTIEVDNTSEIAQTEYFTGASITLSPQPFIINLDPDCPITHYACLRVDENNQSWPCDQDDGAGTQSTFETTTGVFTFSSNNRDNTVYLKEMRHKVYIEAHVGVSEDNIFATSTVFLDLPCTISADDFVWTIPLTGVTEIISKPYDLLWVPPLETIAPLIGSFFDDSECAIEGSIQAQITNELLDPDGVLISSSPATELVNDAFVKFTQSQVVGTQAQIHWRLSFTNLYHENQAQPVFPSVYHEVNYIDGIQFLTLDTYTQTSTIPIDLSSGSFVLTLTPPVFKDEASTGIQFSDPTDPQRTAWLEVAGQATEINQIIEANLISNSDASQVTLELTKLDLNIVDEFEVVVCFSYGDYPNLQDLCDETVTHPVTSSRGLCFDQILLEFDYAKIGSLESEPYVFILNSDPTELADLGSLTSTFYESTELQQLCGGVAFSLVDETQTFVNVEEAGLVTIDTVTDSELLGTHLVNFELYLKDIDIDSIFTWPVPLTLTVTFENIMALDPSVASEIAGSLTNEPPQATEPIVNPYKVLFGETAYLTFNFVNPIALQDNEETAQAISDLRIKITESSHPGVLFESSVEYPEPGFGMIILEVKGEVALAEFASTLASSESDSSEGTAPTCSVTIEVQDTSPEGLSASFTVETSFILKEQAKDEENLDQSSIEEEESEVGAQVNQAAKMYSILNNAFSRTDYNATQEDIQNVKVKAELREINPVGAVFIDFQPQIVSVPDNWEKLWDLSEREKMNPVDREAFEEGLLKIMHASFIHKTEELPQQYVISNLTKFEVHSMQINLNFSDPLLVSQGVNADKIRIKLLKSYFLQPDPTLANNIGRSLAKFIEDDEYIVIEHDLPRQMLSESEMLALQGVADSAGSVLSSGFAMTFLLNFLLSGVMSQLWNIFNTLQIIMALSLLAVFMPANVIEVKKIVNDIINFQLVDKQSIHDKVLVPILGEDFFETFQEDDEDDETDADQAAETDQKETEDPSTEIDPSDEENKDDSLIEKMMPLLLPLVVVLLMIALLVFCKLKILPRCCTFVQKLVQFVMAKLMFNSVLRALMQTYLVTCISVCVSLLGVQFQTEVGRVDFCLALISLVLVICFPIFAWKFLKRNKERLREPAFKMKYDSLYQNIEYYKGSALANTSFFLLRRLLFACVIVFCAKSLVLQVLLADVLSTCLLAYYISVMPMTNVSGNVVQILNEVVVLFSVWMMFHFSDFVPDPVIRYQMAYYFLYMVAVDIVLNVSFLVFVICGKIYRACRIFFTRRKAKREIQAKMKNNILTLMKKNQLEQTQQQKSGAIRIPISSLVLQDGTENGQSNCKTLLQKQLSSSEKSGSSGSYSSVSESSISIEDSYLVSESQSYSSSSLSGSSISKSDSVSQNLSSSMSKSSQENESFSEENRLMSTQQLATTQGLQLGSRLILRPKIQVIDSNASSSKVSETILDKIIERETAKGFFDTTAPHETPKRELNGLSRLYPNMQSQFAEKPPARDVIEGLIQTLDFSIPSLSNDESRKSEEAEFIFLRQKKQSFLNSSFLSAAQQEFGDTLETPHKNHKSGIQASQNAYESGINRLLAMNPKDNNSATPQMEFETPEDPQLKHELKRLTSQNIRPGRQERRYDHVIDFDHESDPIIAGQSKRQAFSTPVPFSSQPSASAQSSSSESSSSSAITSKSNSSRREFASSSSGSSSQTSSEFTSNRSNSSSSSSKSQTSSSVGSSSASSSHLSSSSQVSSSRAGSALSAKPQK